MALRSTNTRLSRWCTRITRSLILWSLLVALFGCANKPPAHPDNLCSIFDEKRGWLKAARKTEKKWGTPVYVAMAFVHRESSYVADARPPRKRLLGVVPWRRLSSAYGYAQATDQAWQDYEAETRRWFVDRDDFDDALDFIGWYNHRAHRKLGIAKTDAYNLYLAYYSGLTGYAQGHWRKSRTVQGYARKVQAQSERYRTQLRRCQIL